MDHIINGGMENEESICKKSNETSTASGKQEVDMTLNFHMDKSSTKNSVRSPQTPNAKRTPKTPPGTPDLSTNEYADDDVDLDSLHSFSSNISSRSRMSCDHPYIARNGTTFSGRKMKYVVHCSSFAGQSGEDYLTPTQRAQKHIRRLKELLAQARLDLEHKDSEILRLTKEVVELRLFKASLSSPDERSNSSEAVTVRENTLNETSQDISPIVDMTDDGNKSSLRHDIHHEMNQVQFIDKMNTSEMQGSFADSGHYEDLTTSSIHSKDSYVQTHDRACGSESYDSRQDLIDMYEKRIEDLIRNQDVETQDVRQTHNDRVEILLLKLAECNTRYTDLVPDYEVAKERIRELERQLEALQLKLTEQEDNANKMYLHMYSKGKEVERNKITDQEKPFVFHAENRLSVPELMEQLQVTQNELENIRTMYKRLVDDQQTKNKVDPEIKLQFLKSAIYYFLTDKENSQGHLHAIESILGFSDLEKHNISRSNK